MRDKDEASEALPNSTVRVRRRPMSRTTLASVFPKPIAIVVDPGPVNLWRLVSECLPPNRPTDADEFTDGTWVIVGRWFCGSFMIASAYRDDDCWYSHSFDLLIPLEEYPYWQPINPPPLPKESGK